MEERKPRATVASIQTEYVRNQQRKQKRKQALKIRLYRRLTVFGILVVILFGVSIHAIFNQKQLLADKEQQKIELAAELESVQLEQKELEKQLVKLDDEEYIAKLARKEYFLSDKNEIIFSIPENKKKLDKNSKGKE